MPSSTTSVDDVSSLATLEYVSPVIVSCNSPRSICPSPSSSMVSIKRSTCEGGKSANLRLRSPALSSAESICPSPSLSNFLKRIGIVIPVSASHFLKTSTTSSATNIVPQWVHFVESKGTSPWHAPHSPSDSSDTPEKEISHSGQFSELSGTMALQAPHSAIAISSLVSSATTSPVPPIASSDIMIHRL